MRDIKFRAWDNVANEMFYCGEEIDVIFQLGSEGIECTDIRNIGPSGDGVNSMEHLIYMQYTGLKDKNSKEIYEGDILEFNNNGYELTAGNRDDDIVLAKVKYSCGAWLLKEAYGQLDDLYTVLVNDEEAEVVGNVFEKPELLEVPQ